MDLNRVCLLATQLEHILDVDKRQTQPYNFFVKYFNWDPEKNKKLKKERGILFEEIVLLIESGEILGIEKHPSRENQNIYILKIDNYAVIVPFVENEREIFLKTAFPSRKYKNKYALEEEL